MGRIVVTEFVSLDGVVEDPGGAEDFKYGGWSFEFSRGDEGDKFKLDETIASEALLLGRVTYEGFADAWPSRDGEFADKFNTHAQVRRLLDARRTPSGPTRPCSTATSPTSREAQATRHDGDVALQDGRVVPLGVGQGRGDDVLGHAVELVREPDSSVLDGQAAAKPS